MSSVKIPLRLIVTSLNIDTARQVKLFQVKLPRGTEKVVAVQASVRWIDGAELTGAPVNPPVAPIPLTVLRNELIGELRLQSCDRSNVFYASELKVNNNLPFGDFSSQQFKPQVYTHPGHKLETLASISGANPVIHGIYRDKISNDPRRPCIYAVNVYTWVKAGDGKGATP